LQFLIAWISRQAIFVVLALISISIVIFGIWYIHCETSQNVVIYLANIILLLSWSGRAESRKLNDFRIRFILICLSKLSVAFIIGAICMNGNASWFMICSKQSHCQTMTAP
jgi:hypothetical protein